MVAEAEAPTRSRQSSANQPISLMTRAKARNLYVIQMLPAREVAEQCGLTQMQVYKLAQYHKWGAVRRDKLASFSAPTTAREKEQLEEIAQAAASLSDEGLLGSIIRANEATQSRSEFAAKDCQAFASAARSLMQVGRTLRGLDSPQAGAKGGDVNVLFFGGFERVSASAPPAEVKPCIDVSATASDSPAK